MCITTVKDLELYEYTDLIQIQTAAVPIHLLVDVCVPCSYSFGSVIRKPALRSNEWHGIKYLNQQ